MLNRILTSAGAWAGLGLASGLYWRELTKLNDFTGATQLSTAHTHALALGMLVLLAVLALAKAFALPDRPLGRFLLAWNAGVGLTFAIMVVKGSLQVLGVPFAVSPVLQGFAGLGHMVTAGALVYLFLLLRRALRTPAVHPDRGPATVSV